MAKHRIFADYTRRYIEILCQMPQKPELRLTVVDGFCGGGAYRLDEGVVAGSPLILLRAVREAEAVLAATRRNGFEVHCDFYFVDRKADHTAFLMDELRRSEFRDRVGRDVHVLTDDFERVAPAIVDSIRSKGRSHRSLFFLDQYGWSSVAFAAIRRLFEELANPEVLITFSVDTLINYLTDATSRMRAGRRIELDPSLGEALSTMRTEGAQRAVIQGFLYRHILERTGASFYTPFFIRSPQSNRSYWLLHLSRHARARDEMARRHWHHSNTFVHPGGSGFKSLGYDPSVDHNQLGLQFDFGVDARTDSVNAAIDQLPRMIRDDPSANDGTVSIGELFAAHCNETPLTLDMISEAVVRLRDEWREVEILDADGRPRPRARSLEACDRVRAGTQRSFLMSFDRRVRR